MANKKLFQSSVTPLPLVKNSSGNVAYALSDKAALAQIAATGCFNDTSYVTGEDQLANVKSLLHKVDPEFVAKVAIYSREKGFMKDMPAVLMASIATTRSDLFVKIFPRVIDNTKMLRNVVQMIRSGEFGRKSLGSRLRRAVQNWLASKDDKYLFRGSIGNSPSLGDVINLSHPRPETESRKALYGYLTGAMTKDDHDTFMAKEGNSKKKVSFYDPANLPEIVKAYESFKAAPANMLLPPDVSFEMLTALPLNQDQWVQIAKTASWVQTRMNLNTFARHGVFNEPGMDRLIADRLTNKDLITKSKVFPYQLLVAYVTAEDNIPAICKEALQQAMEYATKNVPSFDGQVYVFPDVSGSMSSPVTGRRDGATSKVRCIDVAGLVASTVLRNNPTAEIIPFEGNVVDTSRLSLSADNSVMVNAQKLASIGGGSTNCSAPLALLNAKNAKGDLCIFISDSESNMDGDRYRNTGTMEQWKIFKARNPNAKLVCIDITPGTTTQAQSDKSILNVGGFSDSVFNVIESFLSTKSDDHWVREIEKIDLNGIN